MRFLPVLLFAVLPSFLRAQSAEEQEAPAKKKTWEFNGKASRAFPAARAAVDVRYRLTELAYVQQSVEYLPAIGDDTGDYFLNTESAIVAPISKMVGLKVSYVIRYNSEPPVRNNVQLRTTDTFFSSGLTLSF